MTRPLDVIGCEVFRPCCAIQRHARDEPRLGETERRAESGDGSTVVCVENIAKFQLVTRFMIYQEFSAGQRAQRRCGVALGRGVLATNVQWFQICYFWRLCGDSVWFVPHDRRCRLPAPRIAPPPPSTLQLRAPESPLSTPLWFPTSPRWTAQALAPLSGARDGASSGGGALREPSISRKWRSSRACACECAESDWVAPRMACTIASARCCTARISFSLLA
jgi:hypothetical protein